MRSINLKHKTPEFASGRLGGCEGCFSPAEFDKPSPLGSRITSPKTDYTVYIAPDGSGLSYLGNTMITSRCERAKQCAIKDTQSGAIWFPFSHIKDNDHDTYSCKYYPGSIEISSQKEKLDATLVASASLNKSCELWLITIRNLSARERILIFGNAIAPAEGICGRISQSTTGKSITLSTEFTENHAALQGKILFVSGSLKPTHTYLSVADLFWLSDSPIAHSSEYPVALGFAWELAVPVEGEVKIGFCFGAIDGRTTTEELEALAGTQSIINELQSVREEWGKVLTQTQAQAADDDINALANVWLPYELISEWRASSRSASFCDLSDKINSVRLAAPFSSSFPDQMRRNILGFSSYLVSAGIYSFDGISGAVMDPADSLWLPYSVAEYILQTEDRAILGEKIRMQNGSILSLAEVCGRELAHYIEYCNQEKCHPNRALEISNIVWPMLEAGPLYLFEQQTPTLTGLAQHIVSSSYELSGMFDALVPWLSGCSDEYGQLLGIYLGIRSAFSSGSNS